MINYPVNTQEEREEQKSLSIPSDINAEAAVLSAMMIDSLSASIGVKNLTKMSFYNKAHKRIFNAMCNLFKREIEIDILTVLDELKISEDKEMKLYLNELSDVVMSGANINYHIEIVKDKEIKRKQLFLAQDIRNALIENMSSDDISNLITRHQKSTVAEEKTKDASKVIEEKIISLEQDLEVEKDRDDTMFTGIHAIDGFSPLLRGTVSTLGGASGNGKSIMITNIARNLAERGFKVLVYTNEIRSDLMLVRMFSGFLGKKSFTFNDYITSSRIRKHDYMVDLHNYINENGYSLMVNDSTRDIHKICADIKYNVYKNNIDVVIIDLLDKVTMKGFGVDAHKIKEESATLLSGLSTELDIHIMMVTQLNRASATRKIPKPINSDIRYSASLEQNSSAIYLIWNPYNDLERLDKSLTNISAGGVLVEREDLKDKIIVFTTKSRYSPNLGARWVAIKSEFPILYDYDENYNKLPTYIDNSWYMEN